MPTDDIIEFDDRMSGPSPAPDVRIRSSTIDRDVKEVPGPRKPSGRTRTGTTIHGTGAVLLGFVMTATGLFVPLIVLTKGAERDLMQSLFLYAVSPVLVVTGASFIIHGLRGASRRRRAMTEDFWLGDYPWNRHRASFHAAAEGWKTLFAVLVIALFLVPFNYWAWTDRRVLLVAIVLFFDLGIVAGLIKALYLFGRGLKYGTSHAWFERFPFILGEPLGVRFRSNRTIHSKGIIVTLRAVQECYEMDYRSGRHRTRIVRYQTYAETRHVRPVPIAGEGTGFDLLFDLPDGPSSELSGTPATYWELEVSAENPGIDFQAVFLMPVYSRDAAYSNRSGRVGKVLTAEDVKALAGK